jgi:hypothetical protein
VSHFSAPDKERYFTTFTTQSTTTSPQKTTFFSPLFPKPPSKSQQNNENLLETTPRIFSEKPTGLGLQNGLEEQAGTNNS